LLPVRAPDLAVRKQNGEKLAMIAAYDATLARLFDDSGIDIILVGDSLGMTVLGHSTTLPVTLDAMVHHAGAVSRGTKHALVVADMPFLSYRVSDDEAVRGAGRLLREGGAAAVKLEGAGLVVGTVRRLVGCGIPVMAHLGLTPQSVHQLGGFRQQAKQPGDCARLMEDALALQEAGAFALVLECIPHDLARKVTAELRIPAIGIGAGPHCDGQVLVSYDMLGLTENPPSFAKRYAELRSEVAKASSAFIAEVKSGQFGR
jgi:3-methyl-2-oxobutanoate hydroxymethyltransferase